jgi:tRNA dimethylallyltransferase
MNAASADAPLVVILGPTASGKSPLGIEIARRFNGEVIVCDSTQVYRHFDIGTAKVPPAEQQGIPHHLTDLVEPTEVFTAGEYRRRAEQVLADVAGCGKLPVVTAGTGLYLRALLEGLAEAPERSEELRARLRKTADRRGIDHLHRILARIDPDAAHRIAPRDTQKTIRAIEIRLLAGKTVGDIHRGGRDKLKGFKVTKIGLLPDRKALNAQILCRTYSMFSAGWEAEVRRLISLGIPPNAKPFEFIGYREVIQLIEGRLSESEAIARIQQATRQFAKRQVTWFRREPDVQWIEGFGNDAQTIERATEIVKAALHTEPSARNL